MPSESVAMKRIAAAVIVERVSRPTSPAHRLALAAGGYGSGRAGAANTPRHLNQGEPKT